MVAADHRQRGHAAVGGLALPDPGIGPWVGNPAPKCLHLWGSLAIERPVEILALQSETLGVGPCTGDRQAALVQQRTFPKRVARPKHADSLPRFARQTV